LLSFKDAFKIRNIKNYKLAEMYLSNQIDTNEKKAIVDSQRLQAQNAQVQQQSNAQAAQQQAQQQQQEMADKKEMLDFEYTKKKELAFVDGFWMAVTKGVIAPQIAMPVLQQLMPNISIPLAIENDDMEKGMQAKAAEEQMEAAQQQQSQQQPQGQPQPPQQPPIQQAA